MKTLLAALIAFAILSPDVSGAGPVGLRDSDELPPQGAAPIASNKIVEMTGLIEQVQTSPGRGMPYLKIRQGDHRVILQLGSLRYLIAQNFNPKAGQEVTFRAYQQGDGLVAIEVRVPAEKKILKLRDEEGRPLWRGGQRGGRAQRSGSR